MYTIVEKIHNIVMLLYLIDDKQERFY